MTLPPIHLLRTIGHRFIAAVAIVALLLSVLRLPCHPSDHGATGAEIAQVAAVTVDDDNDHHGTDDPDGCGLCHCSITAFCLIPDAVTWIALRSAGPGAQRPASSRVPDGPAHAPDVPPDQA